MAVSDALLCLSLYGVQMMVSHLSLDRVYSVSSQACFFLTILICMYAHVFPAHLDSLSVIVFGLQ